MASEGKGDAAAAGGRKRKRYLPHNKPVKKGSYPLHPGVQGVFITCEGGREHQASREALNILESFYEDLVDGEHLSVKELLNRPKNKKITFADSDSSSSGDDEDDEEEVQVQVGEGDEANGDKKLKLDSSVDEHAGIGEKAVGANGAEKPKLDSSVDENAGIGGKTEGDEAKGDEKPKLDSSVDEDAGIGEKAEGDEANGDKMPKMDSSVNENAGHDNEIGGKENPHKIDDVHAAAGNKTDDNEGDNDNIKTKTANELPVVKQCCKTNVPVQDSSNKVEKSIDTLIDEELRELGDKKKRRFVKLESGCNGVVFIQMRKKDGDKSPKDIVHRIVTSAASTRKHMSRFILRMLPIEVSCYASKEEISRAIKPLVEQNFPVPTQKPLKFAVMYEARANTGIDRMEIIDAVAKSVPGPHKVDLKNPDKTIVVEIARTVCLIGIIEKYKELSKYNLRELTSK
ncbi:uncharacterized protein LOC130741267 [Lotus japonicus]|uniref:uncharacterized protein LOC130741267 n=1 Tax=Lotus japonicus TaxID=34305 RepID=UPI002584029A|nr:uncharacterized protein LOC130741267 [Lotus japonicus]